MSKYIVRLSVCIVFWLILSTGASAAPQEKELFKLEESYNMAVSILFDKELPDVSFLAPDQKLYDAYSFKHEKGEDWVQFYIPKAAVGQWKIRYDKKSNTRCEISYSSYMDEISIENFRFDKPVEDRLPVRFQVNGASSLTYQWKVYAVVMQDERVVGELLLAEGEDRSGEKVERDISIERLSDYENYRLRLDAWQREGVEEIYDSRIAEGEFAVRGHSVDGMIDDFRVELNLTDEKILIDWREWANAEEYLIAVFDLDKSAAEPIYFTEVTNDSDQVETVFDSKTSKLRVDVTGRNQGRNTATKSKTIPIKNGVEIKSDLGELTNSYQSKIEYQVPKEITADVLVNEKSDKVRLSGSGYFSLNLSDFFNDIRISYFLDDPNVIFVMTFQTTLDSVPPMLRLPENKTALNVISDTFVLAGVTESGAQVKINEEEVLLNPDGTFLHSLSLKNGENIFKVSAADMAGNVAAQDVIINRLSRNELQSSGEARTPLRIVQKYLPLILSFCFSILVLLMILIIGKGYHKAERKGLFVLRTFRNLIIGFGALSIASLGYSIWRYISLKRLAANEDYFALAMKSLEDAYAVLEKQEFYLQVIKFLLLILLGIVVVSVVFGLMIKGLKKAKEQRPSGSQSVQSEKEGTQDTGFASLPKAGKYEFECPNCKTKYDRPIKFCGKCGMSIKMEENPGDKQNEERE